VRTERIGDAVLYLGDCLDVLPTLGPVDAVVTDPEYGVNLDYQGTDDTPDNLYALAQKALPEMKRVASVVAAFTGVKHTEAWSKADWRLAWVCPSGTGCSPWGFTCWTPIVIYGRDPYLAHGMGSRPDVYVDYAPTLRTLDRQHPCEKPLGVVRWLIGRVSLSGAILDPFMGSGTTGVACAQLGRKFIGIEIEPKYFNIACRRIEAAQMQLRMAI
jgi:site-specific DNA-methyltransferase (adenine-specific)